MKIPNFLLFWIFWRWIQLLGVPFIESFLVQCAMNADSRYLVREERKIIAQQEKENSNGNLQYILQK